MTGPQGNTGLWVEAGLRGDQTCRQCLTRPRLLLFTLGILKIINYQFVLTVLKSFLLMLTTKRSSSSGIFLRSWGFVKHHLQVCSGRGREAGERQLNLDQNKHPSPIKYCAPGSYFHHFSQTSSESKFEILGYPLTLSGHRRSNNRRNWLLNEPLVTSAVHWLIGEVVQSRRRSLLAARPLWLLRRHPNFTSTYSGVNAHLA